MRIDALLKKIEIELALAGGLLVIASGWLRLAVPPTLNSKIQILNQLSRGFQTCRLMAERVFLPFNHFYPLNRLTSRIRGRSRPSILMRGIDLCTINRI